MGHLPNLKFFEEAKTELPWLQLVEDKPFLEGSGSLNID